MKSYIISEARLREWLIGGYMRGYADEGYTPNDEAEIYADEVIEVLDEEDRRR